MSFRKVLDNLLVENESAVGALFLDPTGETVDLVCAEFTPYQMRVLGAYLGIHLRQVVRVLSTNWLGEATIMHVELENLHIHAIPLPDGYYVALVQRPPAPLALARRRLAEAARLLVEEFFVD